MTRNSAFSISISQILSVVGLALFWTTSFSFSDAAFFPKATDMPYEAYLPTSVFALIVFSISLVFIDRRFPQLFDAHTGFVGASACISGVGTVILFASIVRGGLLWLTVIGSVLMGFGAAVAMLAWSLLMSQLSSTESAVTIAIAFFAGILFTELKRFMAPIGIVFYDVAVYTLCGLIWQYVMKDAPRPKWTLYSEKWRHMVPWRAIIMFAVCSLAGCVIESTRYISPTGMSIQNPNYVILSAAILFAAVIWIAVLKRGDFGNLWPFFVLSLVACLMLLPVAGAMRTEAVVGWISAENWCLQALCWILLAAIAHQRNISPIPMFGLCFPLMISAPYCIGRGFAQFLSLTVEYSSILPVAMAFITVLAIVLALFDGKGFGNSKGLVDLEEVSFHDAISSIGERHELSAREMDVTYLLARGHTLSRVGSELFISMNTVRTHTRKIYNKLDIHTKQELIEMIEKERKELQASPAESTIPEESQLIGM